MANLSVILARYQRRLEEIPQDASEELSRRVVGRTPVDTSSAANAWRPALGGVSGNFSQRAGGDISPVLAAIRSVTREIRVGDVYGLGNDAPYIRPLEYGYSRQAPAGMLRISVAEWHAIVASAARGG